MKYRRLFVVLVVNLGLLVAFVAILAGTTQLRHFFTPVVENENEDKSAEKMSLREIRLSRRNAPQRRAQRAFYQGNFKDAAELYAEVLEWDQTDDDGTLWYRYGYSLFELEKLEEAQAALNVAVNFPRYRSEAQFLLARLSARLGEDELAIEYLQLAATEGYFSQISISEEDEFQGMLENAEFQELKAKIDSNWERFASGVRSSYLRHYNTER